MGFQLVPIFERKWKWQNMFTQIFLSEIISTTENGGQGTHFLISQFLKGLTHCAVEKSQTNATDVTMPALIQALSVDIWKRRVKKQIYVTNATMLSFKQAIWGSIWKLSISKYKCIAIDFHFHSFKILGQIQQIRDVLLSPPPQFGHMA